MQQVHKQIRRAEQDGLFRATTADTLFNFVLLNSISKYFQASPDRTSRYDSLERVSEVDFFISHSWSCPSWMKRLALCHCLNLNLAIGSCGIAFLLAIVILVLHAGSIRAVAQQDPALRYCLSLLWPFFVSLGTYLFGHLQSLQVLDRSGLCPSIRCGGEVADATGYSCLRSSVKSDAGDLG